MPGRLPGAIEDEFQSAGDDRLKFTPTGFSAGHTQSMAHQLK
jgi:hypothetical protein